MDTVRLTMVGLVIWNSLASEAAPGAYIVAARLLCTPSVSTQPQREHDAALRSEQKNAGKNDLGHAFPRWPVLRILEIVRPIPIDDVVFRLLRDCHLIWFAGYLVAVTVARGARLLVERLHVDRLVSLMRAIDAGLFFALRGLIYYIPEG
jgi:hypothetical protein